MAETSAIWFRGGHGSGRINLRLFCFPYAGGTAQVYKDWADLLPSVVQVVAVELPGRGSRSKESPFVSFMPLIDVLTDVITPVLDMPFAFFGHSLGGIIAFELARNLRRKHNIEPNALFIAGRRAPHVPDDDTPILYNLPKEEFIKELHRMAGTPKELLENEEFMELMIPLLRADFQLAQNYEYYAEDLLRCPITVYGGLEDYEVPRETLLPWTEYTSSSFSHHMLPGNHFFVQSSQNLLLELLARKLYEVI